LLGAKPLSSTESRHRERPQQQPSAHAHQREAERTLRWACRAPAGSDTRRPGSWVGIHARS